MRPLVVLALALVACEPALPPPPPPPPRPAPGPPPLPAFAPGQEGTFRSKRTPILLPLPEGRAWRIDDHKTPWITATHVATSSTLLVRTWNEEGRASRARCEERAKLWGKLPDPRGAEILQDRAIDAPPGFDTRILVGVVPSKGGGSTTAFASALGAHAHRCFVWIYETGARGPGAEKVLGERLAAMVESSLSKIAIESALAPRIPREPR
jgi:hypothetical protein